MDWSAEALSCRNGSLFTERTGFAFMSLDDVDVELGSPREGEALTQAQLDLLYRDGFVVCVFFSAAPPMRWRRRRMAHSLPRAHAVMA